MPTSKELKDLDSQLKKTVISAESFKRSGSLNYSKNIANIHKTISNLAGHVRKVVIRTGDLEKRVDNNSRKITSLKNISSLQGPQIRGTNIGSKLPESSVQNVDKNISAITKSVTSIAEILSGEKKLKDATSSYEKKKAEQERRSLVESKLEKRFDGLKRIAERIISPVKSLLDKIIEFFTTVLFGRIVYKLVEWFGDEKNASKVKSLIRFVKDWWPALLGSYILFGNSFSDLIRGTLGIVGRFIFQLGRVAIPRLLGVVARNPIATLAIAGGIGAYAASQQNKERRDQFAKTDRSIVKPEETAKGGRKPRAAQLQQEQVLQRGFGGMFGGGGLLRGFSGGGFASGYVSGEKGVDKVPAMLSDGEFVMSRGAVEKYGVDTLEAMNAAGGGTNKPKMIGGKTYAAGGGLIGKTEYYLSEILKGLSPKYTWAEKLARQAGIESQNALNRAASNTYNFGMNEATKAQSYLRKGGLEKDVTKLMQSGTQYGAGLYDQALKVGNKALSDIQSGSLQKQVNNTLSQTTKKTGSGFFDFMSNMSSSKRYKEGAKRMENAQDKMISFGDKFIKNLPDGPFKEIADKGFIPIPSGNATIMRNLTFAKAMLGPLGRPFKILSNKEVDNMRRKTIENTMNKSGLIVDPKTGEVRMNWNQEDINKGARGGGAYTDKLGPRGSAFNSILGRFTASTEGKGNTLYSDDRYNFNRTVGEYAGLAKSGLLKGSMSDAAYYGASMLGRFAQDIGWLNQRSLGSRIKIGTVDRSRLNQTTGRYTSKEQAEVDRKRREELKLGGGAKLYDKPQKNTGQPYKSRFARPRNAGVRPVNPPSRTSVRVIRTKADIVGNRKGGGSPASSRTPSFSASTRGMRSKQETLGLMR